MLGISIIFCSIFSLRVHLSTYPQKHARGARGGRGGCVEELAKKVIKDSPGL